MTQLSSLPNNKFLYQHRHSCNCLTLNYLFYFSFVLSGLLYLSLEQIPIQPTSKPIVV